jgi:hypothetical protein
MTAESTIYQNRGCTSSTPGACDAALGNPNSSPRILRSGSNCGRYEPDTLRHLRRSQPSAAGSRCDTSGVRNRLPLGYPHPVPRLAQHGTKPLVSGMITSGRRARDSNPPGQDWVPPSGFQEAHQHGSDQQGCARFGRFPAQSPRAAGDSRCPLVTVGRHCPLIWAASQSPPPGTTAWGWSSREGPGLRARRSPRSP